MGDHPEAIRRLPVRGTWAYLDRLEVAPGSSVEVHVSAEAAHEIELVRLGLDAVIDPAQSLAADCAEARRLAAVEIPVATPQTIAPGSYAWIEGEPLPAGPLALGLWLRLWTLPAVEVMQMGWYGLITDIDYPDSGRFGLIVDHLGRIGVYLGDGGAFRHEWLHWSPPLLAPLRGRWAHVAASWTEAGLAIFLDGRSVHEEALALPDAAIGPAARLRLGALAEGGAADDFLEGDVAQPFVGRFMLDAAAAARIAADGAARPLPELAPGPLLAWWPLDEERGTRLGDASGHGRHGHIANHGTWMVGGPRFAPARRLPLEYRPDADPDHGHGLRFCSDDLMDAGWPVAARFTVPADAESGLYAVRVRLAGQAPEAATVAPFVVSRTRPRRPGSLAVLCATLTWHTYGRRPAKELVTAGLTSSLYSTHLNGTPFFHLGFRLPIPMAHPYGFESPRSTRTRSTHLVRTERFLEAWLAREGYPYELITDLDLHRDPALLDRFQALAIVGHSEYWTNAMRDGVLAWLGRGGRVLSLSGDTLSVRVTLDPAERVMECRKIVFADDPRWLGPERWGESWHSDDRMPGGSFRRLGMPSWDVLGMSFKGMIDDGTSTSFRPYNVLAPDHFLFHAPHPVPVTPQGTIGERSLNGLGGASGYEFDATQDHTHLGPAPLPGVVTLASVLDQPNLEWLGDPGRGADLIYWRRPDGGTVINFGSIAAAGALPVDAGMAALMRNALAHLGVEPAGPARG
jgi:hypothetical protein